MIPYGRQDVTEEDIEAVKEVLRSDLLTQGPRTPEFEKSIASYCGASYAVAVNSATSALHLACMALDLGPGDRVWTSPITFVASANCALYCGATIDFVDIDPRSYNMSVGALSEKLHKAELIGALPKVVIPVHFAGQCCDMVAISNLSKRYGFKVIEDASHAVGASYALGFDEDQSSSLPLPASLKNYIKVGSCQHSDITVFSFHPVKIITTGEGGVALTCQTKLAEKMALLRSHGITRNPGFMAAEPDGPWYYEQIDLGFNYRMTEMQAALGLSQMRRLDKYVERRHELASRYNNALSSLPLITPWQDPRVYSALHLYPVRCAAGIRRGLFQKLIAAGINANVHYIPVHTQPYFQKMGFRHGDYPIAEAYYHEAISLPIFQGLSNDAQDSVVSALEAFFANR